MGGTGFIGGHILASLLSNGVQVKAIIRKDNKKASLPSSGIEVVYGNVFDIDFLNKQVADVDLVFSAFGLLGRWGIPDHLYWEVNTRAVKHLLKSCIGSNIKQFIHISSAGVLGPLPDGVVADETFPYNPSNIYERTKCEAEKEILASSQRYGIPFTIIRPEFVYGPGDFHVLGLFKAIKCRRFVLLGHADSLLHPTYIDDLVQGIHLCTDNEKAVGKIFLITGNKPITVKKLAKTIAEELDVRLPKIRIPLLFAHVTAKIMELGTTIFANFEPLLTTSQVNFFTENRAFSYEKARKELGYFPKVDFREGVRKTVRWYCQNGYL